MKTRSFLIGITTLCFIAALAGTALPVRAADKAEELGRLQQAYDLLKMADKDYHGHRAKAMKAVESACHDLGGGAEGRRAGREAQSTSDGQMRAAQDILESVNGMASDQHKVSDHISKALDEIHTALEMK